MGNENRTITINKEVRDYTESVFFGLNLRQCIFSLLAILIAIGLYFLLEKRIGVEFTSWMCIIGAFPFAALGFIKFQGMYAEIFIIELIHSFFLSRVQFIDQPVNLYFELYRDYIEEQKGGKKFVKKSGKDRKVKKRKV